MFSLKKLWSFDHFVSILVSSFIQFSNYQDLLRILQPYYLDSMNWMFFKTNSLAYYLWYIYQLEKVHMLGNFFYIMWGELMVIID